jgi:hypothetical protein
MAHPTIRKGVGMIRIRLTFYDWLCYQSQEMYLKEIRDAMVQLAHSLRGTDASRLPLYYADALCYNPAYWPSPMLDDIKAAIKNSYQLYRWRSEAQDRFPQQLFFGDVAKALTMCKTNMRIEITDDYDFPLIYNLQVQRATRDNFLVLLAKAPARPYSWGELYFNDGMASPYHRHYTWLVPEILAASGRERIHFDNLNIHLSSIRQRDWVGGQADMGLLRADLKNVKTFSYGQGKTSIRNIPYDQEQQSELRTLLCNCLPSHPLRNLTLSEIRVQPRLLMLTATKISLCDIRINFKILGSLSRQIDPLGADIGLHFCRVERDSDSWADVLDLLRSMGHLTRFRLMYPNGWEFSLLQGPQPTFGMFPPNGGPHNYRVYYDAVGKSEQYVLGYRGTNPLRGLQNY